MLCLIGGHKLDDGLVPLRFWQCHFALASISVNGLCHVFAFKSQHQPTMLLTVCSDKQIIRTVSRAASNS